MVIDSVADALVDKVKKHVDALTVGRPEDDCDICAVISSSSADWIESLVKGALQRAWSESAKLLRHFCELSVSGAGFHGLLLVQHVPQGRAMYLSCVMVLERSVPVSARGVREV